MNGHVKEWLPAYHDNELRGGRLQSVEDHLKDCDGCRYDLEQMRKLSTLLQAAQGPERQISAPRFAAQVELRLNEPAPQVLWQKALKTAWQAAPLGLLFAWGFLQAVMILSNLVTGLGGFEALLESQYSRRQFLAGLANVFIPGFPVSVSGDWPWLDLGEPFFALILLQLALTAGIGLLLWGWVASFWAYRQHHLEYVENGSVI